MNEELATRHAKAARLCGKLKSCGSKFKHESFAKALRQSQYLNNSSNKKHDCEPYFCAFCLGWHIGRIFSEKELLLFSVIADMIDSGFEKKIGQRIEEDLVLDLIRKL